MALFSTEFHHSQERGVEILLFLFIHDLQITIYLVMHLLTHIYYTL